ncbi:MAG TPA: rod shape-determining protein MreD, partial [Micavibrio sp.]
MALDLSIKGFENGLRLLVPMALLAALFLLSVAALPVPHAGPVKPAFILMAVYYWSIFRPTLMPPSLCFFTGLLLDIISGLPLGVNAIIFTLVQWIVRDQRRFLMAQAYVTTWAVFILVALGATFLQWGLYGLIRLRWSPVAPVLISVGATTLLFPVVTFFL